MLFDTKLLREIRNKFANVESDPVGGRRIYFENSGGSLTLESVIKTVTDFTGLPDNSGRDNSTSREIDRIMSEGLEKLKIIMGASSGVIALGESTTSNAFKTIAPILRNVPGNNVVTTDLDHPSIYDSTKILAERNGKEWRSVPLNTKTGTVDVNEIIKVVDKNTIALTIIHSSNNLGTRNDILEIVEQVKKINPDIYIVIDGSQYCMHSLINVEEVGCDVYLISSYKTFHKAGAAAVYLSDRASLLPHDKLIGKAENYWELGTREPAGYAGWSKVFDYLCWLGSNFISEKDERKLVCSAMEQIDVHEKTLLSRILQGTKDLKGMLENKKITIYGETHDLGIKDCALLFNVAGFTSTEIVSILSRKGIRVTERKNDYYSGNTLRPLGIDSGVRVSLAHYNSPEEVDCFLQALSEVSQ